ncbi:RagB/SusD family nutrient uptake outer membrane protein [Aquimarina sp. 2201CG14-23]|uniref:RagB/SusD family nutrient uptake outer membrane protein n=1 Tax=Aquimarina mycalae TaxID=3040073 RepID=UPI002477E259|nr:RagB/SusD family nutrient uptake outer membrane protein [Aquimarina sp. 2201CG14-23]MDH7447025.1 RagB/SusD family nutrient uptake outer membrane protein [Aquimarina sp. 2201CG14-23]
MKTLKYILLSFLIITIVIVGCEDNLELEPEQSLLPEIATSNAANVQNILTGIYDEAGQTLSYGGDINLASELLANSTDLSWNGTFEQPAQLIEKQLVPDNTFVRDYWLNAYEVSNQSNIVLASLDVFDEESDRNRVEGEAKFLRGLVYFDLARLYGQPYAAGGGNTQLAAPIVLDAVLNPDDITSPSRNTVEEVYAQVILDLSDAYNLLPNTNGIFADRYGAQALLARVYLQQGNYAAARDAADDVLQNSGHSLTATYAEAFNNDQDSQEDVFAWQITSQDPNETAGGTEGSNDMNTFWAGQAFGGRSGNPDVSINASFFTVFDDPNDERGQFIYSNTGGTATTKWQSQFANIPFLRIGEMHLIRAEANFRLGTSIGLDPLVEINALRARSNAVALGSVTLQDIINERIRELAFEGFALHDIKRLQGTVGALNYDDNFLVMPIPQRERDANPNLMQNPGYGN